MVPVARTRVGQTAVTTRIVRRQAITSAQARPVTDPGVSGPAVPGAGTPATPVVAAAGAGHAAVRRVGGQTGRRGASATTTRVAVPDRIEATGPVVTAAVRGGAAATSAAQTVRAARGTARAIAVAPAAVTVD